MGYVMDHLPTKFIDDISRNNKVEKMSPNITYCDFSDYRTPKNAYVHQVSLQNVQKLRKCPPIPHFPY
jgi:hypothetical protein